MKGKKRTVILPAAVAMFACCLLSHADSSAEDITRRTAEEPPTAAARPQATTPKFSNVFLIVEENHSFSDVVGNRKEMPYLNQLIRKYAVATQYFANTHPSLPNYLWLTAGSADGFTRDVCGHGFTVSADNIVRELAGAGVSWKAYEDSLPSVGYPGCGLGEYVEKHDPIAYLSDVQNNSVQLDKIVPFTEFATDLAGGTLPQFSFITPNLQHDAHDGTLSQADAWLKGNFRKLLKSEMFEPGGSGLLIIVFDEGTNNAHGGGQIPWIAIGPKVKKGYQSVTLYQHQSTLRLILKGFGVSTLPGAAASAPDMTEFFR
jgi:phospholipase C